MVKLQYTTYFVRNGEVKIRTLTEFPKCFEELAFTLRSLRETKMIFGHHSDVNLYVDGDCYLGAI